MALLLMTFVLFFGGAFCQTTPAAPDFVTVLKGLGHYNSILELIDTAGLTDTLKQAPAMTLLLPTDEAISKLPADDVDALKNDQQKLLDVLGYHAVLSGAYKLRLRAADRTIMSSNNKTLRFNAYRLVNKTSMEGVEIVENDIKVANGYVHGINGIMVPPTGSVIDIIRGRTTDMSTLASLLAKSGLDDAIAADNNITLFAPNNLAFSKLNNDVLDYLGSNPKALAEVLLFHVVNRLTLYSLGMRHSMTFPSADGHHDKLMLIEDFRGNNIYIDNAKVLEVDISATNGVIHVIDDILIPTRIVLEMEKAGLNLGA